VTFDPRDKKCVDKLLLELFGDQFHKENDYKPFKLPIIYNGRSLDDEGAYLELVNFEMEDKLFY
jgi:hypothetical protein